MQLFLIFKAKTFCLCNFLCNDFLDMLPSGFDGSFVAEAGQDISWARLYFVPTY